MAKKKVRYIRTRKQKIRNAIIGIAAGAVLIGSIVYWPTRMMYVSLGDLLSKHVGREALLKAQFTIGNTEKIANDCFELIDPAIKATVNKNLGEVTITYGMKDLELSDEANALLQGGNAAGLYRWNNNTIYIKDGLVSNPHSIIHEYGHAFDRAIGASKSKVFLDALKKDLASYTKALNILDLNRYVNNALKTGHYEEYFAEAFSNYWMTPNYLKLTAPNTYEYIDNLVESAKKGEL